MIPYFKYEDTTVYDKKTGRAFYVKQITLDGKAILQDWETREEFVIPASKIEKKFVLQKGNLVRFTSLSNAVFANKALIPVSLEFDNWGTVGYSWGLLNDEGNLVYVDNELKGRMKVIEDKGEHYRTMAGLTRTDFLDKIFDVIKELSDEHNVTYYLSMKGGK